VVTAVTPTTRSGTTFAGLAGIAPHVVDIYHGDVVTDFARAQTSGLLGIIHKASEGARFTDTMYPLRRSRAVNAGLHWGAYHFLTSDPVEAQVATFLKAAAIDDKTLVAVDYEDAPKPHITPNIDLLWDFLTQLEQKLGRKAVIYSGNLLKETLRDKVDPFISAHKLWLCEYAIKPRLAPLKAWEKPWLWQYCDGSNPTPYPKKVPGILGSMGKIDCNHFDGTPEQLAAEWVG
jgi:lysozyme